MQLSQATVVSTTKTRKVREYIALMKLRLTSLVIFSTAITFILANIRPFNWLAFGGTILGGILVVASSNSFNQICERHLDKMMNRTANRPLPSNKITVNEALMVAFVTGIIGVLMLYVTANLLTAALSLISLLLYVLLYTPLKRITPLSVFVGAIPGALPALLGYTAASGVLSFEALIVFAIQFFWQFPHFWTIAWVLDDDYKKAGFVMLPSTQRDKHSAYFTIIYTAALLPIGVLMFGYNLTGWFGFSALTLAGGWLLYLSINLYRHCSIESARKLMFASFVYLPIILLALVIDRFFIK
ncbi:MAG: protoheme IX farnesyltransferase [Bacteroidetes bacterium]|nr:protoheme IX farnesyltransferase [Bacteroidota bacterium]